MATGALSMTPLDLEADAKAKAALFPGCTPQQRVKVLADAGRVTWEDQPYVVAQMEAAITDAVAWLKADNERLTARVRELEESIRAAALDFYRNY